MNLFDIEIADLTKKQILNILENYLLGTEYHQIATINPEFLVTANKEDKYKQVLQNTSLNIADGFGVVLASWLTKKNIPKRIPGVDLIYKILPLCIKHNKKVLLLGGLSNVALKAKQKLQSTFPNLQIEAIDGGEIWYDNETKIWHQSADNLAFIQAYKPDVLLVALGSPKQEYWIADHKEYMSFVNITMGIGGSLDYISENVPRAPFIMRKMGLEWLFRVFRQPYRLKRISNALIVFLWLIFKNYVWKKNK